MGMFIIYLSFFPVLDLYLFLGLSPWQRMDAVNVNSPVLLVYLQL